MLAGDNRSLPDVTEPNIPGGFGTMNSFQTRGMAAAPGNHGNPHALPRLMTHNLPSNFGDALRTAPPGGGFGDMAFDQNGSGLASTINPAQLHAHSAVGFNGSPFTTSMSPFTPQPAIMEDEGDTEWMQDFNNHMSFGGGVSHQAHQSNGENNPNRINMGNPFQFTEGYSEPTTNPFSNAGTLWPNGMMPPQVPGAPVMPMQSDISPMHSLAQMPDTISPETLQNHQAPPDIHFTDLPSNMPSWTQNTMMPEMQNNFQPLQTFSSDGTSISSNSGSGSARGSSVTSVSTDSITDVTRQALLVSLSQSSSFGHGMRKYSQSSIGSSLSPPDHSQMGSLNAMLPSTYDLQRFVGAYIQYFHPHFPFLHIPTLTFDAAAYTSNLTIVAGSAGLGHTGIIGGGGCLILAMAAIGALYEFEKHASKELFEAAKKMIQLYLEERRKANLSNPSNATSDQDAQNTPLWLVQAMLINVIYGHNCGDKIAGDIASTHCTALVSLARAAELTRPLSEGSESDFVQGARRDGFQTTGDVPMTDGFSQPPYAVDEEIQWRRWISLEERKRTLFAIFHMSSILVSAYNHAPALMNSEIQLDLPCDEELWTAETSRLWASKRAAMPGEQEGMPFAAALSTLLSTSQRQENHSIPFTQPFGPGPHSNQGSQSDLRPSTFGCLILIDALHNYIWETRQRHSGHRWTTLETESMHAYIEPALRAWQAAWASHPKHHLQRPNPFGQGPLSADSIPLLDLAYVRLFVHLGKSKEAFWQRDFDAMAEELARGSEIIQHAEHSDSSTSATNTAINSRNSPEVQSQNGNDILAENPSDGGADLLQWRECSKREKHLRKAAFYAADSLSMSGKLGVTFADFTSRELPVQSALCSFDCAQVLAEWVATVQERVGRFLGVIGRDQIDYSQVPAILLLEDEDCKLLEKISLILSEAEQKIRHEVNGAGQLSDAMISIMNNLPSVTQEGFGPKILKVTAFMLERAAVWPGKLLFRMCISFFTVC